jgi:glycosyltransferase involved in cell wall biosynthesis
MRTSETSIGRGTLTIQDEGQPLLSIVVPAFNEAGRIGSSIEKIDAFMSKSPISCELIVVDDGSGDSTSEVVAQAGVKGLRLVRNERNCGKGFTVRRGVLAASGTYVLFTDADLSAPIEEADKLFAVAVKEGADIVIGSRAVDRSYIEKHQSRVRELGGILFNWMVRLLLGLPLNDTQCGFKLFNRERCLRVFELQTTPGFGFDAELLYLAKRQRLKICETPVRWSHTEGSKVSFLRDGTRMFFDLLRIRWNAITGRYS